MKVHLIRRETIEHYSLYNPRSRAPFEEMLTKLKLADREYPSDIKVTFCAADLLGKGTSRVILDVGGNAYRMICKYAFGDTQVHLFIAG